VSSPVDRNPVPFVQQLVAAFGLVCAFVRTGGGQVKVVVFEATGMVGHGVLSECLLDPGRDVNVLCAKDSK